MDPERRYYFPMVGYNYRLTNVACALLCAQLERANEMVDARRALIDRYRQGLAGIPGLAFQPVAEWADPAPWLFSITVDEAEFGVSRDALAANLASQGIETRPVFVPIHTLPPYQDHRRGSDDLGVTEHLGATGLSLPTSSAMESADADRVIAAVIAASS